MTLIVEDGKCSSEVKLLIFVEILKNPQKCWWLSVHFGPYCDVVLSRTENSLTSPCTKWSNGTKITEAKGLFSLAYSPKGTGVNRVNAQKLIFLSDIYCSKTKQCEQCL